MSEKSNTTVPTNDPDFRSSETERGDKHTSDLDSDSANNIKGYLGTQKIRTKLIIVIGAVVVAMISILSFIMMANGKRILDDRMKDICNLAIRNLSESIKHDLLLYYHDSDDPNLRSLYLGRFYEGVLDVRRLEIGGLEYASIIDREGNILAHTLSEFMNTQSSEEDRRFLLSLTQTQSKETEELYEFFRPILVPNNKVNSEEKVLIGVVALGFSKDVVLRPIRQITQIILIAVLIIAIASMGVSYIVATKMTAQVDAIVGAVRKVGQGNLNVQIPIISKDELGSLAKEFNKMIVHLREKLHMQKFISKLTVQMIRKRSSSSQLPPAGERRHVTLVFSDIRSFTAKTEKLAPEETVYLINEYLNLQSSVIEENDGIVDKFMGDQVMAIFMGEHMADNAVRAAVTIQRSIRELNNRRQKKRQIVLDVGIGINDGMVVMGNMGSQNRLDYTVIGDAVNLASRLCGIAHPGQIIAPMSIAERLDNLYPTIRLDSVKVKGRSQSVDIFEIDYDRATMMDYFYKT